MAGHSQFKNIMYRKGAQDAKRAKLFTKLIRELTVAARGGLPDPQMNARLRAGMAAARAANVPNDTIERAVKRGSAAADGESFEEVRYEGYGAGGVAVIVEALTDNRNRTAAEIRTAFARCGGALGETNSVAFQFQRVGSVRYQAAAAEPEAMLEAAIEIGAEDCQSDAAGHQITCEPDAFNDLRDALEARFGAPHSASLTWRPLATVAIGEDEASALFKLLETLDDNDDVQQVSANFDVPDAVLQALGG